MMFLYNNKEASAKICSKITAYNNDDGEAFISSARLSNEYNDDYNLDKDDDEKIPVILTIWIQVFDSTSWIVHSFSILVTSTRTTTTR